MEAIKTKSDCKITKPKTHHKSKSIKCKPAAIKTNKKIIETSYDFYDNDDNQIYDFDTSTNTQNTQEEKYMPNFSKNYEELIKEIKINTTHKELKNKLKISGEKQKPKKNKSAQEKITPVPKIESLIAAQNSLSNVSDLSDIEEIRDFKDYTINCLKLISTLRKPKENEIEDMKFDIPDFTKKKKLAIFDLDETLIHCEIKNPEKAEKIITLNLPNNGGTSKVIF